MPDPVGVTEIAERLNVKRSTVQQWQARGIFPPADFRISRNPGWWWETVEAWARSSGRL